MNSFRFNIKQLLLLVFLIGLVGGLLSAVFQRPYRISFSAMDVNQGKEIALAGPGSLVLVDLDHSRMGKRRRISSYRDTFSEAGPQHLQFVDDGKLLFLRKSASSGYRDLVFYEIADDKIAGQVVLPNWSAQHNFTSFGEHVVAVQKTNGDFSFYETDSGRRIRLQLPTGFNNITYLATGTNGQRIVLIRNSPKSSAIEVWNIPEKKLEARWNRQASGLRFLPYANQLIVLDGAKVVLLDIASENPIWERNMDFRIAPESLAIDPERRQVAMGGNSGNGFKVEVIQTGSGETVSSFDLASIRNQNSQCIRFIEQDRFAVLPNNSDQGLTILNSTTGRMQTIGRFYRWPVAIFFTAAFIIWCWAWGKLAWKEEQRELSPDSMTGLPNESSIHVADSPPSEQHVIAWNLMAVGGVFAIAWSVIPMFFFGFGVRDSFLNQLFFLRVGVALFGLAAGLMAASRGFGRCRNWLNLTAGLQILNLIGFDLLNPVCGIFELFLINRNQTVKVAKLIHPAAQTAE